TGSITRVAPMIGVASPTPPRPIVENIEASLLTAVPRAKMVLPLMSTADDLKIEVIRETQEPDGTRAQPGHTLLVHYVGTLTDGTKFDSSRDRKQFFSFKLGEGQVIKGWDEGLVDMQDGEIRKLTIPSRLAYGEKGVPGLIPPNATLVFEIEL